MLKFKTNIGKVSLQLKGIDRKLQAAAAAALNGAAGIARDKLKDEMGRVFDRPTPFTMNSTYIRAAKPTKLLAEVGFRGRVPEKHYLVPQIHGGERRALRFEAHLRRVGILQKGQRIAPAKDFPLDAYGNVPRNVYAGILADLQAHPDEKAWSTKESRRKRARRKDISKRAVYFASRGKGLWYGRRQHLPPGIYKRTKWGSGSLIIRVFAFVSTPVYKPRLPMQQIVEDAVRANLPALLDQELSKELRSA